MNLKRNLHQAAKLTPGIAAMLLAGFISLSATAATISYPQSFSAGWNLAGNGLTTPIDVKTTFGAQAGITTIWKWDAAVTKWAFYAPSLDTAGTLASYAASKGYSVLTTINQGEGYWVNASTPVSLGTASGTGFSLAASNLVTSWNLTATGDNVAPAAFTANVGNVTTLWAWDNTNSAWYFYAPSLVTSNTLANYITSKNYKDFGALTLDNGRGFWVNYAGAPAGGGTGGATAPAAPTNAAATASSATQISVNWTNVSGATAYNIYRSTSSGVQLIAGNKITTATQPTAGPFADSGLTAATIYYYKVTAVNATGESVASAEVQATTQVASSVPAAPTGMAATAASATQINLSWSAVTGATGYNVYRSTASGVVLGAASNITASPLTAASFNDTGLTAATAYYYKVTTVNANGESTASAEMSATTSAVGGTTPTITGLMGGSIQTAPLALAVVNVTTFAGSTASGAIDGTGTAASFTIPGAITTDGQHLFVADESAHVIRKIVIATGAVTTLAGSNVLGSADGQGANASFNKPTGITTDGSNLYVSDASNNNIRKIVIATGVVTTLAGSGVAGAADGTGTAASFKTPYGITTDGTNLYVVDYSSGNIRKIVIASGAVTTLAGSGTGGFANGIGAAASFKQPNGITTDGTNLYVADYGNNQIRKVVIATGEVSTVAGSQAFGSTDGIGSNASFYIPWGITTDGSNLYVTEQGNKNIRKIVLATGAVTTLAGSGVSDSVDGTGTAASFTTPYGITTDGKDIYVTEPLKIRKISAAAPTAPASVTATVDSVSQISVNWTNVTGATAYNIYRSTSPNVKVNTYNKITIGTKPTAGPFVDRWLATGTTYYYKVTAITATGESIASTEVSATTLGPTAPTGVTATAASASQVNLSWTAVTGATGYNIYRGTVNWFAVGAASKITASPLTTASFNDTGRTAATIYYYKVTTIDANGESVASTAASATTQPPPLVAPTVTPGTKSGGAVMGPMTLSGTVTPVTLSPALTMPPLIAALTTDGTSMYAYASTAANGSGVYKIDKASGATSLLAATIGNITALTSDGTNVFVLSYGTVGGVYGATTGAVFQITPAGVVTLVTTLPGYSASIYGIAVVGNNLYFAVAGSAYTAGEREIKKVDLTTKVISTLTFGRNSLSGYMVSDGVGTNTASGTGATFNWLGAMTTDGTYLYVLEAANANPGIVRQISLADGSVKTLGGITRLLGANYASWLMGTGITTDGAGNVYVVNQASSQIIKYDIATNAASVVATGSAAGTNCASNKAPATCTGFHGGVTSDGTNLYTIDGNALVKVQ